ncbi:unnamed protein product [Rotaria sp. Silwood2]|nr:unnamed protein product [Rotaria sp. Silwood2]
MLLSVKELYETTGILIRRVDLSEAQAGKGLCDRKAAVIKGEIRRYVDEKHDCTSSAEFVAATKSTQHLTILSCNNTVFNIRSTVIALPASASASSSLPITGTPSLVSSSQSFTILIASSLSRTSLTTTANIFNQLPIELEIKVWRAFAIGSGKTFRLSDFEGAQKSTPLLIDSNAQHLNNEWKFEATRKEENSDDENSENELIDNDDDSQVDTNQFQNEPVNHHGFDMWECTYERYILQFCRRSDRDNHVDTGKHKLEPYVVPMIEKAKLMYKNCLHNDNVQKNVPLNNFTVIQDVNSANTTKNLQQGWALPSKKIQKRFNSNKKKL